MTSPSADDVPAAIRHFFERHGVASLRLPDGWFGRPFDNWHQLSEVDLDGETLVITLDDFQVLRVRTIDDVAIDSTTLRISVLDGTWEWTPYGGPAEPRLEPVGGGAIEFHAPQ